MFSFFELFCLLSITLCSKIIYNQIKKSEKERSHRRDLCSITFYSENNILKFVTAFRAIIISFVRS